MDLQFQNLQILSGTKELLNIPELRVSQGSLTALMGPNGSGKSTLLKTAMGFITPHSGQVLWNGKPRNLISTQEAAKKSAWMSRWEEGVRLTPQQVVWSGLFPLQNRWVDPTQEDKTHLVQICDELEIAEEIFTRQSFASLSLGEQQLVHLARTLIRPVEVLFLDEVTSALDLRHKLLVGEALKRRAEKGTTIFASFHNLDEAAGISTQVAILNHGKLAAAGEPDLTLKPELIQQIWGCTPAVSFPSFWKLF